MKKLLIIALFVIVLIAMTACASKDNSAGTDTGENTTAAEVTTVCEETTENDTAEAVTTEFETESATEEVTTAFEVAFSEIAPSEKSEVIMMTEDFYRWYKSYTDESAYGSAAKFDATDMDTKAVPVELSWNTDAGCDSFTVSLSTESDMSRAVTYEVKTAPLSLDTLFVGTDYYWTVTAHKDGNDCTSEVYSFKTADTFRLMNVKNLENARDIGGRMTSFGIRIKQGIVYRTATIETINKTAAHKMLDTYGLKTQLDLRADVDSQGSQFGKMINFINISAKHYKDIFSPEGMESTKNQLLVFADAANYPIVFHCAGGRDRTGTLAFLLEAVCGVSELNMYRDYEASLLPFTPNRTASPDSAPSLVPNNFTPFLKYLKEMYNSDDLRVCAEQYMLDIGLTSDQINDIRANLLGDGYKRVEIKQIEKKEYHRIEDQAEPVISLDASGLIKVYGEGNYKRLAEPVLKNDGAFDYTTFTNNEASEGYMYLFKSVKQVAPVFVMVYRTEHGMPFEIFASSENPSASTDNRISVRYTAGEEWNYILLNLEESIATYDGITATHMRLDFINANEADISVDVAYVGLFTSEESALNYIGNYVEIQNDNEE